jgi:hypothetical protein
MKTIAINQSNKGTGEAFDLNPKRFKGYVPKPPALPKAAWINKPETDSVLYD